MSAGGSLPARARMRGIVFLLTVMVLAACAESGLPPLATDQIRVRFPPGGVVDVIEIDAVERLPLRKAELVAPDGRSTPASYLNVNSSPRVTFNQEFATSPYGDAAFVGNVTPGVAAPGLTAGSPHQ